jgi:indole-3-glycerol phosphate synthase
MKGILAEIIRNKRCEVEAAKATRKLTATRTLAEEAEPPMDFGCALLSLSDAPIRIIAECKQKSPSKGSFVSSYDPAALAMAYEDGGAAAISVLTDQKYFGGTLDHLRAVKVHTSIPVLRKDFIIDEYQIYEARAAGADSFLLLSGVLDVGELQYFIEIGRELGMEPLVESHNKTELEQALRTDAKIIGINNRNLESFAVDLGVGTTLASFARSQGRGRVLVCESGVKNRNDIETMRKAGYTAFLVGEALMSKSDPCATLRDLLNHGRSP